MNIEQTDTQGSDVDTKLEGWQPYICLAIASHFNVKFFLDTRITLINHHSIRLIKSYLETAIPSSVPA